MIGMTEPRLKSLLEDLAAEAPSVRTLPVESLVERIKRRRTRRIAIASGTTLALVAVLIGATVLGTRWFQEPNEPAATTDDGSCEPARRYASEMGTISDVGVQLRTNARTVTEWLRERGMGAGLKDVQRLRDTDVVWVCAYDGSGFPTPGPPREREREVALLLVLPGGQARLLAVGPIESLKSRSPRTPISGCGEPVQRADASVTDVRLKLNFPSVVQLADGAFVQGTATFTNVSDRRLRLGAGQPLSATLARDGVVVGDFMAVRGTGAGMDLDPGEQHAIEAYVALQRCDVTHPGIPWNERKADLPAGTYSLIATERVREEGGSGFVDFDLFADPATITLR